jgi:hypothetical protein
MAESRATSTTLVGKQWANVTVVSRCTSPCTTPDTRCDYPATSPLGWSDRGGDSPKLLGYRRSRPRQSTQHHISGTRIQIALKLTPDRFR